jgi:predicted transposase YbfD/YdcC
MQAGGSGTPPPNNAGSSNPAPGSSNSSLPPGPNNAPPPGADKPNSSEDPAKGAPTIPKEKPENMASLARQIAQELIPKFDFLIQVAQTFHSYFMPAGAKEEKPSIEALLQKSPSTKSESVAKGEAKTIQQSQVPEEIDPVEKTLSALLQTVAKNFTGGKETLAIPLNKEQFAALLKFGGHSSHLPGSSSFVAGGIDPKNPLNEKFFLNTPQASFAKADLSPEKAQQNGGPQQQMNLTQQELRQPGTTQPAATHMPLPNQAAKPVEQQSINLNAQQMVDPANAGRANPAAAKGLEAAEAVGKTTPRRDMIHGVNREESPDPLRQKTDDDRQIVRVPVLPENPLAREWISKDGKDKKRGPLKEDEGFKLGDLMLMLLCAVICGAKNMQEIAAYLKSKEEYLKAWLGLKHGVPSLRFLTLLMKQLDPTCIDTLIQIALGKNGVLLQTITAWETDRGILIAELRVDRKPGQEIQIRESLDQFDLEGTIVTVESPFFDKKLSRKIKRNGGDYLIALKNKHGEFYKKAQEYFALNPKGTSHYNDLMEGKTLTIKREVRVTDDLSWMDEKDEWEGLSALVHFLSETRGENRTVSESRFYLSSLAPQAQRAAATLRTHATLENTVDWYLDLDFTHAASDNRKANFMRLLGISQSLLQLEKTQSVSIDAKKKKAKADPKYLRLVLAA